MKKTAIILIIAGAVCFLIAYFLLKEANKQKSEPETEPEPETEAEPETEPEHSTNGNHETN